MASEAPPQAGQLPSSPVTAAGMGSNHRTARIVAIVAGLLGAVMAIATPLLPVKQTTAELNWPQNGVLQSVDAPLIGYVATDLTITVPCRAAAGLAGPERRPYGAAVNGAEAGPEGRRPRAAHRTGQQRPARHRP
jgi:arabinosyltransferase C